VGRSRFDKLTVSGQTVACAGGIRNPLALSLSKGEKASSLHPTGGSGVSLERYLGQLFLAWFNQRHGRDFTLLPEEGPAAARLLAGPAEAQLWASDGRYRLALAVDRLYEIEDARWNERRLEVEDRLSRALHAPYLLWMPPQARLPGPEPGESEFVLRAQMGAAPLLPGGGGEVLLPVTLRLGKTRDDGAYVSVVGSLARYWTAVSERVRGGFNLDSTGFHRLSRQPEVREEVFSRIADYASRLSVGDGAQFEAEEAWTIQKLAEGEEVLIVGCPPSFDPTDGTNIRRLMRRRVAAANEALGALEADLKSLALVGVWEHAEDEGASAALRGFDSAVYSNIDIIAILADGEARPALAPRRLPWGK
jgi:hypothetical protein